MENNDNHKDHQPILEKKITVYVGWPINKLDLANSTAPFAEVNLGHRGIYAVKGHGLTAYEYGKETVINSSSFWFIRMVECGIHWSRFRFVWQHLLTLAEEKEEKVIITTHSLEFLQKGYDTVDNFVNLVDISLLRFGGGKFKDKLFVQNYSAKVLDISFQEELEIRGQGDN